jgi:hypothetical protein
MKNDEIKYYQYVGSQEYADEYLDIKPLRNKVYSETEKIGRKEVSYWVKESLVYEINLEWKLVEILDKK